MTREPLETDSPAYKSMKEKLKVKMSQLFLTDKPENARYIDFKEFYDAPDQGDDFCEYAKAIPNDYKRHRGVSHNSHKVNKKDQENAGPDEGADL